MSGDTETRLSAAHTRLILDRPFLGALVLRMPMKAADPKWCKTIGTDARALYYNPEYIDSLSLEQTRFALAHEALHCALCPPTRAANTVTSRVGTLPATWLSTRFSSRQAGMAAVQGALYNVGYEGMMAEEIYPRSRRTTNNSPTTSTCTARKGHPAGAGCLGRISVATV